MSGGAIPYDPGARPRRRSNGAHASVNGIPTNDVPLQTFTARELVADPIEERGWIVRGLVPDRAVTLLSGDGGVGKSILSLQLAAAVASGDPFLGRSVTRGRVLIVNCEDERAEQRRRMDRLPITDEALDDVIFHERVGAESHIMQLERDPDIGLPVLREAPFLVRLKALVLHVRPVLLILDSLYQFFPGNENDRPQAQAFMKTLRELALGEWAVDPCPLAVMPIMHPSATGLTNDQPKGRKGTSGSTAWRNAARSLLYFTATDGDDDTRTLTVMKANYGKAGGKLKVKWADGAFALVNDSENEPAASSNTVDRLAARSAHEDLKRRFVNVIAMRLSMKKLPTQTASNSPYNVRMVMAAALGIDRRTVDRILAELLDERRVKIGDTGLRRAGRRIIEGIIPGDDPMPEPAADDPPGDPSSPFSDGREWVPDEGEISPEESPL